MRQRITRHQEDRAARVPGLRTLEEPLQLAQALRQASQPQTLVVVDCLTLWLTNWLMPAEPPTDLSAPPVPDSASGAAPQDAPVQAAQAHAKATPAQVALVQIVLLLQAIEQASGPVIFVGNEIGLGVIPLGRETRAFVDALGVLNQRVAQVCERVTLMAAGLPLRLKRQP